jgi:hypothetical protein
VWSILGRKEHQLLEHQTLDLLPYVLVNDTKIPLN